MRNSNKDDPRIKWEGYGYIIEGFNVKRVGKVPYTITFYSPQGYLYGDDEGNLEEGDKDFHHPWKKPSYSVWRGQYLSQALFSDELWQNTKNLAKPRYRSVLPFRYPRACLPEPPIDLKDPTWWGEGEVVKVKTNWVNQQVGDIFNGRTIPFLGKETQTQRFILAYLDLPENSYEVTEGINMQILFNLPSFKGDMELKDWKIDRARFYMSFDFPDRRYESLVDEEGLYHHLPREISNNLPLSWEPELSPISNGPDQVNLKVERTLDIEFEQEILRNKWEWEIKEGNYVDFPNYTPWYNIFANTIIGTSIVWNSNILLRGSYEGYNWWSSKPTYKTLELLTNRLTAYPGVGGAQNLIGNTLFLEGDYRLKPLKPSSSIIGIPYRNYLRNISDGVKTRLELWVETSSIIVWVEKIACNPMILSLILPSWTTLSNILWSSIASLVFI